MRIEIEYVSQKLIYYCLFRVKFHPGYCLALYFNFAEMKSFTLFIVRNFVRGSTNVPRLQQKCQQNCEKIGGVSIIPESLNYVFLAA